VPPVADQGVLVRRATPLDRARAIDVVFSSLRAFGIEPEPEGMDSDVMTFGDGLEGAYEIVATIDGEVCGVSALVGRGRPEDGLGWVSKVFVDARFRRRGAGRKLMNDIVREARARGYRRLGLRTRTIFREAIALYEQLGWIRGPAPESGPCDRTYFIDIG
jgi:GNAT superfamily N-acetyltransferase